MSKKAKDIDFRPLLNLEQMIYKMKVQNAPSSQSTDCPSIEEKIGTKVKIKVHDNGQIDFECFGVSESKICPKCPLLAKER